MPGAAFHSFYWAGDQAPPAPDPALGRSGGGAYVPWETSIITFLSLALVVRWSMSR